MPLHKYLLVAYQIITKLLVKATSNNFLPITVQTVVAVVNAERICEMQNKKPLSIYVHIPFCKSKCGYCNFYSTTSIHLIDSYIAKLKTAIKSASLDNREAVSIYFGGGTPSLLGEGLVEVLDCLREHISISTDIEITLEANPTTVSRELLTQLRSSGFNRISFGMQSDNDTTLAQMGRTHNAHEGLKSIELARSAGFENISIDVMLGTPHQTISDAVSFCERLAALGVPHISAYLLKIEEGTPFASSGIADTCPDSDYSADIYTAVAEKLVELGYCHYEISNFAKHGYESYHNSRYWTLGDYLGIGCSAYSCLDNKRFHFPSDLVQFIETDDVWSLIEQDGAGGDVDEYLMLSLRLSSGINLPYLREHYDYDTQKLEQRAITLADKGLLRVSENTISMTTQGFLLFNSVLLFLQGD